MKVLALMPAYKIMDVLAVRSLVAFQADLYSEGHNLQICFTAGYTAAHGRNTMFRYAAGQEADYVLSLDSDHVYSASAFHTLIEKMEKNNLQMLSAKYYARSDMRAKGRTVAMGKYDENMKFSLHVPPLDDNGVDCEKGLVELDVLGLGFCVFKHEFVKKMTGKYENLFHTNKRGDFADDVVFCSFVKDEGYKLFYDADTIIGHISTIVNQ